MPTYQYNIQALNALAGGNYSFEIDALNAICVAQGLPGGYKWNIDAYNALATSLGATVTYQYELDALNTISILTGGTGGYSFELDALNFVASNGLTFALTVVGGTGSGSYQSGQTPAIVAAAPASGYRFSKWVITYGSPTTKGVYSEIVINNAYLGSTTLLMPQKAVTVTAVYELTSVTAKTLVYIDPTFAGTSNGSISAPYKSWLDHTVSSNTVQLFKRGTTLTLAARQVTAIHDVSNVTLGAYGLGTGAGEKPIIHHTYVNSSGLSSYALWFQNTANTLVENIVIQGVEGTTECAIAGIFFNNTADNTTCYNGVVENCEIYGFFNGIRAYSFGTTKGTYSLTFRNVLIHAITTDGIYTWSTPGIIARYMYIHHVNRCYYLVENPTNSTASGDCVQLAGYSENFDFQYCDLDKHDVYFKNCFIYEHEIVDHPEQNVEATGILAHNKITTPLTSGSGGCGIYLGPTLGGSGIILWDNDFSGQLGGVYNKATNTLSYGNVYHDIVRGIDQITSTLGLRIYNNTFYNCRYGVQGTGSGTGVIARNNIFDLTVAGDIAIYQPSSYTRDSDYNCYGTGTTAEAHSIIATPGLNSDYTLAAGSPCIDTGVDVGLDYNGAAPDMGAKEYGAAITVAAPVFTSAAAISAPENQTAVWTIAASDATSFVIISGTDAALFALTAGGVLTFLTAPNYEAPAHVGNTLTLTVRATGPGGYTDQAITVTVTDICKIIRAFTYTDGSYAQIDFDVDMDEIAPYLSDITFKNNASDIDIDTDNFNDWGPYQFYFLDRHSNPITFVTGDVIKVSIAKGNIQSTDGELLETVTNHAVTNNVFPPVTIVQNVTMQPNPHGTCQKGDVMYCGNRSGTAGATITKFYVPTDLTQHIVYTITGRKNIESLVYDSVTDKLYGTSYNNDGKGCILRLSPSDPSSFDILYNSADLDWVGSSPSIATDGTYIYGVTNGGPARLFKIRISDGVLVSDTSFPNTEYGHSSAIHVYSNRTEFYAIIREHNYGGTYFLKVNCSDMSYVSLFIAEIGHPTDDFYFRYIDNNGGIAYIQGEGGLDWQMAVVNTQLMTYTLVDCLAGYGSFSDGTDLYTCGWFLPCTITKWPAFNMASPVSNYISASLDINEMFFTSDGRKFFTTFTPTSHMIEFTWNSGGGLKSLISDTGKTIIDDSGDTIITDDGDIIET